MATAILGGRTGLCLCNSPTQHLENLYGAEFLKDEPFFFPQRIPLPTISLGPLVSPESLASHTALCIKPQQTFCDTLGSILILWLKSI